MKVYDPIPALQELFGDKPWPRAVRLVQALAHLRRGATLPDAVRAVRTTVRTVQQLTSAADPVRTALRLPPGEPGEKHVLRARLMLGQMLLGRCAEMVFEERYRSEMHSQELELVDLREGGTDTDYRLINGKRRPLYRINIKFHGARFRRAAELVNLQPEDCFPLATYKIHSALEKQDREGLPYFFAIVGVPDLSSTSVGALIPEQIVDVAALVHASRMPGKREFEDAVVDRVVAAALPAFAATLHQIREAHWYLLSARKADRLLRALLFERVFALRIRNFARSFRGAELDMHFSLSHDLVPLEEFFSMLRAEGVAKVSTLLERGDL